ncbi:MAG: helix-turn-helix transcriptional regulator [Deltaproteobacteria bacterium]|nr:helix-turn-helix transcriptional regulator [Deltaproteobacteria bacterium]MBW1908224.1 helix-turn-helix transcriptional regulator [Deltaproteobacteria bacterium]MBW2033785.1 helix-turn-helix transcriptional regulator [Deltaproteobacteria bacterium]MBW2114926.1 helix-turn-helix transcriptional regulator [Deltaproteobacteria bacterium]MBW2169094.1 helix-turn-helix transcriptional regulator [Deltaproteobacteria bacterium]
MIDKQIGIKIRQIRKSWGISQIELAERIGISFQQVQKYEKGSTRISASRLMQISEALNVKITVFFEETEKIPIVSDLSPGYIPGEAPFENIQSPDKEEMTMLKLFRKIKNRKVREGIIKQLQGLIELENQK